MQFSWQTNHPLFCLAPMEGATDAAFRQVIVHCGKPDVMFTEFVNVSGMQSVGRRQVAQALRFEDNEQPLIAQIWGLNPDHFYAAAQDIVKRGFAGVDINMGCPDKAVIKKGAGGALIKNRPLVKEIIQAVKSGVDGNIPVSVKIRIGFDQIATEDWATYVLEQDIAALSVHGRTVSELSKVPCHWDEIGKVVRLRDEMHKDTVIIGNGDVFSYQQGLDYASQYGVQGVMIGRGVFYNPWIFDQGLGMGGQVIEKTKNERIRLLLFHLDIYERLWGIHKPFSPLKKYFKIYIQSFDGASEFREKLMETQSIPEARALILANQ